MNEQTKPYVIQSQRLAGFLMMRGFTLRGMQTNFRNPKYNVFLFNPSDELSQAIEDYRSQNK